MTRCRSNWRWKSKSMAASCAGAARRLNATWPLMWTSITRCSRVCASTHRSVNLILVAKTSGLTLVSLSELNYGETYIGSLAAPVMLAEGGKPRPRVCGQQPHGLGPGSLGVGAARAGGGHVPAFRGAERPLEGEGRRTGTIRRHPHHALVPADSRGWRRGWPTMRRRNLREVSPSRNWAMPWTSVRCSPILTKAPGRRARPGPAQCATICGSAFPQSSGSVRRRSLPRRWATTWCAPARALTTIRRCSPRSRRWAPIFFSCQGSTIPRCWGRATTS